MIASTEVLDTLKSIGLNLYERKIYVALLAKSVATAAQVSEIAGVPRSRSYDVLESLADKGFVVVQPSKPIKYVALQPAEALDRTKDAMKHKFDIMTERIEKVRISPILDELSKIYSGGFSHVKPTDMTGTFKGADMINRHFQSLLKSANTSIEILTTEKGLADLHDHHFRTLKKLTKGGVKLRIAAPATNTKTIKAFKDIGDVKTLKAPAGRVAVIDGEHLLMALTDETVHESQDLVLWANSEHAIASMAAPLFAQIWKGSR